MRPITNPDFNQEFSKWQGLLSSASDAEIKHYLLTGDPVAKLAAAAVQDAKQKEMQAPQAPTQSVIAQKAGPQGLAAIPQGQAPMPQMQQPQPQMQSQDMAEGGLTELSTGGMFDEASYAGGGIVSFADGGDIPSFAGPKGSLVSGALTPEQWDTLTFAQKMAYQGPNKEELYKRDQIKYPSPQISQTSKSAESFFSNPNPFASVQPAASTITGTDEARQQKTAAFLANQANQQLSDPNYLALVGKKPPLDDGTKKDTPLNLAADTSGIGTLKWDKLDANASGYDALKQVEKTPQQLMEERNALIGPDEYKQLNKDKLAAMEAKTSKMEENAPWMALAKFGLGIAGARRGQEAEAISKSGISAIQDYAEAKDKVQTAREKQFELSSRQAQADRAEKVAAADYGLNSAQHTKAENRATELAKLSHKNDVDLKNATGAFEAAKGNAEIAIQKAKLAQDAANAKATLAMHERMYNSKDAQTAMQFAKIKAAAVVNVKKDPDYLNEIAALGTKYKDKGGVNNNDYKFEANQVYNKYLAQHQDGLINQASIGNAVSADSLYQLPQ